MTALGTQQHRGRRRHRHHGTGHRAGGAGRRPPRAALRHGPRARPGRPPTRSAPAPRPARRKGPDRCRRPGRGRGPAARPRWSSRTSPTPRWSSRPSSSDWPPSRSCSPRWRTSSAADCLLATNTSSLSVTAVAGALRHPGRFVGLHFFNPAPLLPLVEVVSGFATDDDGRHHARTTPPRPGARRRCAAPTPPASSSTASPAPSTPRPSRCYEEQGRRPRHHRRGAARVRRLQDGPVRADRPDRAGRERGRHPLRVGGLLPGPEVHARPWRSAAWSSRAGSAARRGAAGSTTPRAPRAARNRAPPAPARPRVRRPARGLTSARRRCCAR